MSQEPEYQDGASFPNRDAAIVNLFYWNNLMHDVFYHFGFTETGRNFQNTNNYGADMRGGVGNDELLAQAQDGGGVNNANMLTLADGVNGQMQMYLWTASSLAELVEIKMVSANGLISVGDRFEAVEGAMYSDANSGMAKLSSTNSIQDTDFIIAQMGCGESTNCGGTATASCNDMTGKIALIDRGGCSFVQKVYNAQLAGAVAAIVMNNNQANPDEIIAMGGTDPEVNLITIPSAMISFNNGLKLKEVINNGGTINGDLEPDPNAPPGVKRDGDFDNGVIAHEYGHGISTRTSPQTATGGSLSGDEQGGEGWADYYALFMTTTKSDLLPATTEHPNGILPPRGIGSYVRYQDYALGSGIRPRRYSSDMSINEYTYTGSTNSGFGVTAGEITIPHGIGFIWCTMLYDLTQKMVDLYGMPDDTPLGMLVNASDKILENKKIAPTGVDCATEVCPLEAGGFNTALQLVNTGISMQPASPTFSQARDAILAADDALFGGLHNCDIWSVFARRGLGFGSDSGTNSIGDETESYATHPDCNPAQVYYTVTKSAASGSG
ncbi:MAG: M36 family metallopeptidase [Saprospiraceae bacterium]